MIELFLERAIEVARAVGEKQREFFHGTEAAVVDQIKEHDVKLRLDCECQELITEKLLHSFPDHTVLGEEGGSALGVSEYQWIVDPIDGTGNFFYRYPHFCTAIALQQRGQTILAVTYDPIRDELFTAVAGKGAWLNGHRLSVSPRTELNRAMVAMGFSSANEVFYDSIDLVTWYATRALKLRTSGSAGLDLAYIAAGRVDIYLERKIRLWDIAGGILLINEAGGRVMVKPLSTPENAFSIVASNGKVPVRSWDES